MRPLISATLIVRNEARFLTGCLESLSLFADEIVVVDTGSVDATRDIAVAGGARVFDFVWRDDFSAARNFALDQARGEWILYIDADERIVADDLPALRRDLEVPELVAASVRFKPFTGNTAYPEFRLVRNRRDIRFEGAMHETYLPDLSRVLAQGGAVAAHAAVTMQHLGYDGDQSHKLQRNLTLLLKQIERAPDRLYLRWHLGCVYRDLGRVEDARAQWRLGVEKARLATWRIAEEAFCFLELARAPETAPSEAWALINEGLALQPDNHLLRALKAEHLVRAGEPAEALDIYQALSEIDAAQLVAPISYEERLFGPVAYEGMGGCLFKLGRFAESAIAYRRAAELEPDVQSHRVKARLAAARVERQHT